MNLHCFDIQVERFFILPAHRVQARKIGVRNFSKWVYPERFMIQLNRLLSALLCTSNQCKPHIGAGIVRIEFQGRDQVGFGFLQAGAYAGFFPHFKIQEAERGVCVRQIGIQR